jgi:hypothetical protein
MDHIQHPLWGEQGGYVGKICCHGPSQDAGQLTGKILDETALKEIFGPVSIEEGDTL